MAEEFKDRGIAVNAIAPIARNRMTMEYWPELMARPNEGSDFMDPANVAAMAVWR